MVRPARPRLRFSTTPKNGGKSWQFSLLVAASPTEAKAHPRGSAAAILAALDRIVVPEGSRRTQAEIDAYLAEERASWD